ncbi:ABC transporter ATP-binding protein [Streptomyces erythrochromogenes]|uniref:ABC transporter ATP-binding protein n=1 Tax=Streptomyces erythrochromogenes TaxID=285574 RepID=UPI00342238A3
MNHTTTLEADLRTAPAPTAAPPAGDAVSLEFRDVRRTFGATTALAGLDLTVRPGELVALLGPSGCGKSTALRMVAGFDRPDHGQVLLGGEDVSGVPAHLRNTGMVFQSYGLFPHLSACDNVAFGLRMRGVRRARRRARAAELLDLVGLSHHGNRFPHQLSGGQCQRVALARALALAPRVLLLDEPLSALDAQVRSTLRDEIRRIQRESGITTLCVTHDQEEALSMADRIAVIKDGRLEQCATPGELYARPATAFVAEFVGTTSRLPGRRSRDGRTVDVLGQTLAVQGPASAGGTVDVLVRPENVKVQADPEGQGQVTDMSFRGPLTHVTVRLAHGSVTASMPTEAAAGLNPGTAVSVALAEHHVLLTDRPR